MWTFWKNARKSPVNGSHSTRQRSFVPLCLSIFRSCTVPSLLCVERMFSTFFFLSIQLIRIQQIYTNVSFICQVKTLPRWQVLMFRAVKTNTITWLDGSRGDAMPLECFRFLSWSRDREKDVSRSEDDSSSRGFGWLLFTNVTSRWCEVGWICNAPESSILERRSLSLRGFSRYKYRIYIDSRQYRRRQWVSSVLSVKKQWRRPTT